MRRLHVAAGALNQTPLDWDGNLARILAAIRDARRQHVQLLCLPEMCITGYGCEDAFHSVDVQQTALAVLREIVAETEGIVVSLGLPLYHRGGVYNTACLVGGGEIFGFVGKQNLAGEGLHYEPRWFKPWPDNTTAQFPLGDRTYPLGDLIFDLDGIRIAFEICEDAWVATRPGGELASAGADILLNPSASHFAFGKHQVRTRFVLDGSRAFHVVYVYANLLGNEAGRAIYDGDVMIASCGKMVAKGPRFSFADHSLTRALVDIDAVRVSRARANGFRALPADTPQQIRIAGRWPDIPNDPAPSAAATLPSVAPTTVSVVADSNPPTDWEQTAHLKEEEFTRAMALGLFDYLRKSHAHGFVVSLSGGADSAAVATLCHVMSRLAIQQLGANSFRKKLGYLKRLQELAPQDCPTAALLTCVYQSTRNSSQVTRAAAAAVAAALQATYFELDVDDVVQSYIGLISSALGRPLTWTQDDVALQNIQARTRGPSVWLLANLTGSLLLATSNRSEAAVGYATMDGDTCGGLSPIAGIDKAFLRHWLQWMETTGPAQIGPFPALAQVNRQAPTAELRPLASLQTDETDLMPYDLLDAVERAAIRDKKSPVEAYELMREAFPHYGAEETATWIQRFFQLWCRNQWKRERYAPSFHLDDENLDPKTWCRFPILSGGYARELRELMRHLARERQA